MKKLYLIITSLTLFVLVGCASSPYKGMTYKAHSPEYDQIKNEGSIQNVTFDGKSYSLIFDDEFNGNEFDFSKWYAGNAYTPSTVVAKGGDGSWLGSKIWGNSQPYDNLVLEGLPRYAVICMGQKVIEQKDGVLHLRSVQEKRGNDWHIFLPSVGTNQVFEIGTLYEIRYKLPVKGKDTVLHMCLSAKDDTYYVTNEQGYTFREMFFCEMLTGKKDYVQYNPSMWIGKKVGNKQKSYMDNAVPDWERNTAEKFDFNNSYNVYDDNPTIYKMPDEEFYEWHTATCVYDNERFAVYHDGLLVYEWVWDKWEQVGKPQDWNGLKGARQLFFSYGLAGDWPSFFDNGSLKELVGNFEDKNKIMDLQIDYVRVWRQN